MSYYEYHVAKRYVQFEGALRELANYAALIGKRVLLLTACDPVTEEIRGRIQEGIDRPAAFWMSARLAAQSPRYARYLQMAARLDGLRSGMRFTFHDLGNLPVTWSHIRSVAELALEGGYDTVVGIGGGRAQDFARALTRFAPVQVILAPTLAATNASVSTLSVIYANDGRIDQYWRMDSAPELVLADTGVLIRNPPRALSAGIGDIMSTYCEALCNHRLAAGSDAVPAFSMEGLRLSAELLHKLAAPAMEAIERREITPAFENVVSMILHNCGPLNMVCTTGYAHVLDEMLLALAPARRVSHGLRVGFAVLPMLCHLGVDTAQIREYAAFCRSAGIPTSLRELGLEDVSRAEWRRAFEETLGRSGNHLSLPFPTDADDLIDSLDAARCFE